MKIYGLPLSIRILIQLLIILSLLGCSKKQTESIRELDQSIVANQRNEVEISKLESLWNSHSPHAPVALKLGNLYAEKGDHIKAAEYYESFLEMDSSIKAQETRLDFAKELFKSGRTEEAKQELNILLEKIPNHAGALYNLGAIEGNVGNDSMATEYWSKLIEIHPADSLSVLAAKFIEQVQTKTRDTE